MKLLFIHTDEFSYHITEKTEYAEVISDEKKGKSLRDVLVVYVACERCDESFVDRTVVEACREIEDVVRQVGAKGVVIYPYAHLSRDLAHPPMAVELLRRIEHELSGTEVIRIPFGWYKAFTIKGKGHPLSELSRSIDFTSEAPPDVVKKRGKEHPVCSLIQRFREIFLDLGFDEVINPSIVDEEDVYLQYGLEAPLILDRVFYLAGLDRADIGIGKDKLQKIQEIVPGFNKEKVLQRVFREYKEGKIESDDLIEVLVRELSLKEYLVKDIIEWVFPELKALEPQPTRKTLRSHMTALWYKTLQELQKRESLPLKLFSIGSRFRREQRQDASHLFESTSASCVIMDEGFGMDEGREVTSTILKRLGFPKCHFRVKEVTSNYYAPGTDTEVLIEFGDEVFEVANIGLYSAQSLANYGIRHTVFNLGFGVERLGMLFEGIHDIRALVYPQFCPEVVLMDEEIARLIGPMKQPATEDGRKMCRALLDFVVTNKDITGPAELTCFEGEFLGKFTKVYLYNWDEGKRILGSAALNRVYIHNGNIFSFPDELPEEVRKIPKDLLDARTNGIKTSFRLIDLIVEGFVAKLEDAVVGKSGHVVDLRWRMAKRPHQLNLDVPERVYKYITGRNKKIFLGGPLFFGLRGECGRAN
jgi:O-phosphoseryl-tRNA synthetase